MSPRLVLNSMWVLATITPPDVAAAAAVAVDASVNADVAAAAAAAAKLGELSRSPEGTMFVPGAAPAPAGRPSGARTQAWKGCVKYA